MNRITALREKFRSIVLKDLILDCGLIQAELARISGAHRATLNVCINRGYIPQIAGFKTRIEEYISTLSEAMAWLKDRGLPLQAIWKYSAEGTKVKSKPRGWAGRSGSFQSAMVPGDPGEINQSEVSELLRGDTLRHFKMFRSPFTNDIRDVADIYMSEEHRYIAEAMMDAAKHGGFLAVIGEVGGGKSVIRKKVVSELAKDDNSRVIYPRMIDKTRISASSLCDAIIMDLSDEKPKAKLEQKTRQVEALLKSRSKAGCHVCLMIEEAHDLTVRVLKLLKRFYEIEDGYRKCIGIILIGQPELGALFNEADHYDMREVIRRCQVAEIRGLNGNMKDYLQLKFKRINVELKAVMTDEAITALGNRLMDKDERGRKVSNAYPLTVNNYVIRAMNAAADMGEALVTAEVIMGL
ncbi:MAG: AAA family ATPase [Nitrospiraceae bacterium]|nr:AAA family ATPase [Nitrospiraceae bacterium]